MAQSTEISWTDHTWSPVWGCTEVSPACDNCYARTLAHRFGYGWNGEPMREFGDHHWNEPVRWNKRAAAAGTRPSVFPSMCDPLDKDWPDVVRERFWRLVDATPYLTWLILTKRIGNYDRLGPGAVIGRDPANVWVGATVVNQEEADRDIPKLLATPARVRFLSIEPMLGPIDLSRWLQLGRCLSRGGGSPGSPLRCGLPAGHEEDHSALIPTGERWFSLRGELRWVIVGAESGRGARALHLDWVRSIVQQCHGAGVAVHVKQLGHEVFDTGMSSPGEHWPWGTVKHPIARIHEEDPPFVVRLKHTKGGDLTEWPEDLRKREFPEVSHG